MKTLCKQATTLPHLVPTMSQTSASGPQASITETSPDLF